MPPLPSSLRSFLLSLKGTFLWGPPYLPRTGINLSVIVITLKIACFVFYPSPTIPPYNQPAAWAPVEGPTVTFWRRNCCELSRQGHIGKDDSLVWVH